MTHLFPREYRGAAFVALHGFWNRLNAPATKIIRIRFRDGKLSAATTISDRRMLDENAREVWGGRLDYGYADGSMLITDEGQTRSGGDIRARSEA